MSNTHEFATSVTWSGQKKGSLSAGDLPSLDVASPPVFGGHNGTWTPEHMFVAAAEICVMLTFLAMADFSKLEVRSYRSDAKGKLEKPEGEGFRFTNIEVKPRIEIVQVSDVARAERILRKAEANCLVSKSLQTPVHVNPEIVATTGQLNQV
jgi:peroxiredoxin-like protein